MKSSLTPVNELLKCHLEEKGLVSHIFNYVWRQFIDVPLFDIWLFKKKSSKVIGTSPTKEIYVRFLS